MPVFTESLMMSIHRGADFLFPLPPLETGRLSLEDVECVMCLYKSGGVDLWSVPSRDPRQDGYKLQAVENAAVPGSSDT